MNTRFSKQLFIVFFVRGTARGKQLSLSFQNHGNGVVNAPQKKGMGLTPAPDLPKNSQDFDGIEGDSEGTIRSDYFSLDSHNWYPKRVAEEDWEESSIKSDNPSWVDPGAERVKRKGGLGFDGIELQRWKFGGSCSDSTSNASVSQKLGEFDGKLEFGYADAAKSELLAGEIGVKRKNLKKFWLDSKVKAELGIGDDAKGEVGFGGIGIKRKTCREFWSDSESEMSIMNKTILMLPNKFTGYSN